MKITYYGHACFGVESDGYTVILDPYKGVQGLEDICLKADEVICSHEHFDHNYKDGVELSFGKIPKLKESFINVYHDDKEGTLRGRNRIAVLEGEGKRVVHMGDLGHRLTPEITGYLKGADVLMIPVGGHFTIDASAAAEIVREIAPKYIIPMHYRDGALGLEVIGTADEFLEKLTQDEKKKCLLVKAYRESAEI